MAISYEQETYGKAREAAKRAYEVIPQVNASLARKLPLDKEEAIQQLTEQIWPLVQQEYAADNFTEGMSAELSKSKADDWFKMWYLGDRKYSPRLQAEQVQFEKFQDLVKDGKWYSMPKKELDLKMTELGFDPNSRDSRKQFLDVLSQHQINYDRGNIVQQEVGNAGPVEKLGMALNPTVTDEAVRQSLTGDFDDGRLNRAAATDLVTGALMSGMSASKNLMASPLRIGLADAGAETLRQAANAQGGYRVDPFAPIGAGVAAATVPGGAQWLGSYLSSGGSMGARPLARGFQRGLRGADDPVKAERENLKNLLISSRNSFKDANDAVVRSGANMKGPQGGLYNIAEAEASGNWDKASDALHALGYRSMKKDFNLEVEVSKAQHKLDNAINLAEDIERSPTGRPGGGDIERAEALAEAKANVSLAEQALKDALARRNAYKPPVYEKPRENFVEDIIGFDPRDSAPGGITGEPTFTDIDAVLKESYDAPAVYPVNTASGTATPELYAKTKVDRDLLRSAFPEKYAAEASMGANKRNYKIGLGLGKTLGLVGTSIEPNLRANPFQPESYADKVTNFKETKWFRDLPKEKKLAIERALKGEK